MAGLVFGAAGAAVGSLFGQPQIGWMVGSALGNALFPTKTQLPDVSGPRLTDLKFSTSTYGTAIPYLFGMVRLAGTPIWATDIVEHVNVQNVETGGKGGPSGSQQQTTYSYSVSMAIAFCRGTTTGVRKIWANGKLIYDVGDGATVESIVASNKNGGNIRFYPGDQIQLVDSFIEATLGVGNSPAYRNVCYVVLQDLDLTPFGNSIPNIEAEIVVAGSKTLIVGPVIAMRILPIANLNIDSQTDAPVTGALQGTRQCSNGFIDSEGVTGPMICGLTTSGGLYYFTTIQDQSCAGTLTQTKTWNVLTTQAVYNTLGSTRSARCQSGDRTYFLYASAQPTLTPYWYFVDFQSGTYQSISGAPGDGVTNFLFTAVALNGTNLYVKVSVGSVGGLSRFYYVDLSVTSPVAVLISGTSESGATNIYADADGWYVADATADKIFTYPHGSYTAASSIAFTFPGNPFSLWRIDGGFLFETDDSVSTFLYNVTDAGALSLVGSSPSDTVVLNGSVGAGAYMKSFVSSGGGADGYPRHVDSWFGLGLANNSTATVASIIQTLAEETGLTAIDLDVSELVDVVDGYVIARRMTARSAMEPLMSAFYFDAVESDNVLKFVKRGGAAAVTLTDDDLAAHPYGGGKPDPVQHDRLDETQLPKQVTALYLALSNDYQQGTQSAQRQTARSEQIQTMQLPMVLSDDKAKQIADVNLYATWWNRDAYRFSTSLKYLYLDPTDVVDVVSQGTTRTVRLIKADQNNAPGVIAFDSVRDEASTYSSIATGSALPTPGKTVTASGPTLPELMDIPLLRDVDDLPGFYLGACGFLSGWSGEQLYVSNDSGQTYVGINNGQILLPTTIGRATTALGVLSSGLYEMFDKINSVTVSLTYGTLQSVTRDQIFNSLANTAALWNAGAGHWEILQFMTATFVSTGIYTLSNLLRARLGTTYAVSGHAIGDDFVLLDPVTVRRLIQSQANVGASMRYKAVTIGSSLQSTTYEDFTNGGVSQKPLPPVNVGGGRNASLDLIVNWDRQTRYQAVIQNYVGTPLGEASEAYEVDILNPSLAVLRTISATSPTITYTAAQQIADFGIVQSSVRMNVYQISGTIGRGFPTFAQV